MVRTNLVAKTTLNNAAIGQIGVDLDISGITEPGLYTVKWRVHSASAPFAISLRSVAAADWTSGGVVLHSINSKTAFGQPVAGHVQFEQDNVFSTHFTTNGKLAFYLDALASPQTVVFEAWIEGPAAVPEP